MITATVYYWRNNITEKIYIGSTAAPHKRIFDHINKSTNKELREDFKQYGLQSFTFGILEFVEFVFSTPKDEVRNIMWDKEQKYIDQYLKDGDNLIDLAYNVNLSVRGVGKKVTDEQRKNMSAGGKGKVLSEDHKRMISQNHISKQPGYINHFKGKNLTDEHKLAVSKGQINHKKKVLQYSSDGDFIAVYSSLMEAAKKNNFKEASNISKCASGTLKSYHGFIWKSYNEGDEIANKIHVDKPPKIIMYNQSMARLGVFNNPYHVEKEAGIHHTQVAESLKSGKPTASHYFQYEK